MMSSLHDALSTRARLEAASWDARLRSIDCTPQDQEAFAAWLEADAQNVAAFEALQAALTSLQKTCLTDPDLRRLRDRVREDGARRRTMSFQRAAAAVVAAVLLASGVIFWTQHKDDQLADAPLPRFETGTGEQSLVTLPDGSRVTLDSRTLLELAYTPTVRRLNVVKGQAYFEVTHDPSRPFMVTAGQRSVTAVGTAFDVKTGSRNVTVTVVEGRVRIGSALASGKAAKAEPHLVAGERLIADLKSGRDNISAVDVTAEMSWRTGRVLFEETPLGEVLEDLNRYTDKPFVLRDRELAELRVSGMFMTTQPLRFVNGLSDYLPITVEVTPREVTLSRRLEKK